MRYRLMGRTNANVSEIAFGAWGIGQAMWVGATDTESERALETSLDLGVNLIDTALGYGDGHSERIVGSVVRRRSDTTYVATKVPPRNLEWPARDGVEAEAAFPKDHILRCTEISLKNLGLETIDLLQFHVWSDEWTDEGTWRSAIDELKAAGKIRWFGISLNEHQPANGVRAVESGAIDVVQCIYNVFDQSPEDELFPVCERENVGVIARVPLDEGGLTGKIGPDTVFPPDDWRNGYFRDDRRQDVYNRVEAIARDLDIPIADMPEVALRFCLSATAVSTVAVGMRSIAHVEANAAVPDLPSLTASDLDKLRPHRWVRDFYAGSHRPPAAV
jgi:aryl-alcohol dehydrogenase-like predicted oxidoreductase